MNNKKQKKYSQKNHIKRKQRQPVKKEKEIKNLYAKVCKVLEERIFHRKHKKIAK